MNKTIHITAEIPERWVDVFCSFLKDMESNGNIGHTARMLFVSDVTEIFVLNSI